MFALLNGMACKQPLSMLVSRKLESNGNLAVCGFRETILEVDVQMGRKERLPGRMQRQRVMTQQGLQVIATTKLKNEVGKCR